MKIIYKQNDINNQQLFPIHEYTVIVIYFINRGWGTYVKFNNRKRARQYVVKVQARASGTIQLFGVSRETP